jgi:hypothetical protein
MHNRDLLGLLTKRGGGWIRFRGSWLGVVLWLVSACSQGLCSDPSCDGDTVVSCDTSQYPYQDQRTDCTTLGEVCVEDPNAPAPAFCAASRDRVAACAGVHYACMGDDVITCDSGYDLGGVACGSGTTCLVCSGTGNALCGVRADPACGPNVLGTCDGNTLVSCALQYDVACGVRAVEHPCAAGTMCLAFAGSPSPDASKYSACTLSTDPDPACPTANLNGESARCDADTMTECFLGYDVYRLTCAPGTCTVANGYGSCAGPDSNTLSSDGSPRGA